MPYIKPENRIALSVSTSGPGQIKTSGELNYLIHLEIEKEVKQRGESYSTYNDIIGVLEILKTGDYESNSGDSLLKRISRLLTYFNYADEKFVQTMGALTCVQHELYRRLISVLEDKKKDENGDISLYSRQ